MCLSPPSPVTEIQFTFQDFRRSIRKAAKSSTRRLSGKPSSFSIAGSSLDNVLKCNVYCTSVEKFAAVNAVYSRYFPKHPPARIFVCVPAWFSHFDIEIDCIAAV